MRDLDHPETRLLLGIGNDSARFRSEGADDEVVRGLKSERMLWECLDFLPCHHWPDHFFFILILSMRDTHPNFSCVCVCHNSSSSVCLSDSNVAIPSYPRSYFTKYFSADRPRIWHGRTDGVAVRRLRGAADPQLVQEQLLRYGGAAGNAAGCRCCQL